ncbi:porin [Achromobacter sp. F4_2707]|uniref:porin n=1 Tax=Achromobacter sp. F4_2707 TaxID=3114286 RepID=UPI0039C70FFB
MKKTLLAAALALGFTGVAQAETSVTLYGLIDAGFGWHQSKGEVRNTTTGATQTVKSTRTGLHDGTQNGQSGSRFGLRGTEDLGNGLRAEFTLEQGFNIGSGGFQQHGTGMDRQFSRQAWIGLASDSWGSLRFGRQHNVGTDFLLGMIDPFGGGFGLANGGQAFAAINTNRMDNTVKYVTPNFSGFQFGVAYSFNTNGGQSATHEELRNPNVRAFSTGLRYANGPLGVALSYDQKQNSRASEPTTVLGVPVPRQNNAGESVTVKQWVLGASYDFEVVKLSGAFGQLRDGAYASAGLGPDSSLNYLDSTGNWAATGNRIGEFDKGFKANSYLVGLSAPLGAGNLMVSWGMIDPRSDPDRFTGGEASLEKQHTYALGYTYDLSKRTNVYAYGAYQKNAGLVDDAKKSTVAVGLRHRF